MLPSCPRQRDIAWIINPRASKILRFIKTTKRRIRPFGVVINDVPFRVGNGRSDRQSSTDYRTAVEVNVTIVQSAWKIVPRLSRLFRYSTRDGLKLTWFLFRSTSFNGTSGPRPGRFRTVSAGGVAWKARRLECKTEQWKGYSRGPSVVRIHLRMDSGRDNGASRDRERRYSPFYAIMRHVYGIR